MEVDHKVNVDKSMAGDVKLVCNILDVEYKWRYRKLEFAFEHVFKTRACGA